MVSAPTNYCATTADVCGFRYCSGTRMGNNGRCRGPEGRGGASGHTFPTRDLLMDRKLLISVGINVSRRVREAYNGGKTIIKWNKRPRGEAFRFESRCFRKRKYFPRFEMAFARTALSAQKGKRTILTDVMAQRSIGESGTSVVRAGKQLTYRLFPFPIVRRFRAFRLNAHSLTVENIRPKQTLA